MAVEQRTILTARGDRLTLSLFTHAGEDATVMVTVDDADDSVAPTAEFTMAEAGEFREALRALCERGSRHVGCRRAR